MVLNRKEQIHFVGIGGAGMFPMAEILHRQGYRVTGSDMAESSATEQLRQWGIAVQIGHGADLVRNAEIVVYSSAVSLDCDEMVAAKEQGLIMMKRAVMLGDLMRSAFTVAIAGTHGKTTTTSMVASILNDAKREPTVVVGGIFRGSDAVSGAMVGDGSLLVAEADEYDRSFLQMYPSIAVVTNIEEDHLDIYKDLDDIKETFCEFINRVPFYGQAVLCIDDEGVRSVIDNIHKPIVTYGFNKDADFSVDVTSIEAGNTHCRIRIRNGEVANITVPLLGDHNIQNAVAAFSVAYDMGITVDTIADSLRNFCGVKRRMERLGVARGVTVIDDYAHHPTEVAATLEAVVGGGYSRVTVLFQPHLYSRTQSFYKEFASALSMANRIFVLPIYKARELPIDGVTSSLITEEMSGSSNSVALVDFETAVTAISSDIREDEVVLLMGAGDVWTLGAPLLEVLSRGN